MRGWDGTLFIQGNEIRFVPVRSRDANKKKSQAFPIKGREDNTNHWRNLLDAHRAGSQDTWSPIDLAYRTQTAMIMGMLSYKQRKVVGFDNGAGRITMG